MNCLEFYYRLRSVPRRRSTFACIENRQSDDLFVFVTADQIIVSQLAVRRVTGFLEVDVEDSGFWIVRLPKAFPRRLFYRRYQPYVIRNGYSGHSCLRLFKDAIRRVKDEAMTKPLFSFYIFFTVLSSILETYQQIALASGARNPSPSDKSIPILLNCS